MRKKTDQQKVLKKLLATKIGHGIAAARKRCGITQEDLGVLLGVEPETVSRFERGATIPSLVTLQMLADALATTMANLIGESSPMPNDQASVLSGLLSELKPEDRLLITGMIKDLCVRLRQH